MVLAEFIVVCIVLLVLYRPLLWMTKWVILRAIKVNTSVDKEATQIGNLVMGDQAGGDINKGEPKAKPKPKK